MPCEYCNQIVSHHPRCPYYSTPKSHYLCSICQESIVQGEEYIKNTNGEYAHWECVDYPRDLIDFLGLEILEMEGSE